MKIIVIILALFFLLFYLKHFNNTDSVTLMHAADLYSPLFSVLGLIMMVMNFIGVSFANNNIKYLSITVVTV